MATQEQFTGDVKSFEGADGGEPIVLEFDVKSGAVATIARRDLVVRDSGNAGYVKKAANGESNTAAWIGVAVTNSTETASADGVVEVAFHPSGLKVVMAPTTPGNLAQAIKLTLVTLDVDGSGNQTVDENDTTNGALRVLTYDNSVSGNETITVYVPCNLVFVS